MLNDTRQRVATEALMPTKSELRRRQSLCYQFRRFVTLGLRMFLLGKRE
ncbi:hypothetical protein [Pseudoclavibacter caeni]|jgi:hypothetical protein|nr:hypothetical protein [Pseudoclavibacter caeni]NYJ96493.1 hypothetical protein [Pseudoclavibacter caeni]